MRFLNHVKVQAGGGFVSENTQEPPFFVGTLTEIIPIVPEVHATLHPFRRINVSAWMSHWTELHHRAREARSGGSDAARHQTETGCVC